MAQNTLKERYVATLIGCGIGDTFGMAVESWSKEQIVKFVGKITGPIEPIFIKDKNGKIIKRNEHEELTHFRDFEKGEYTDDTILTLAIGEAIAEKGILDLDYITQKQVQAYQSCKQPDGSLKGGFGGSTIAAFEKIISGVPILEAGSVPGLGTGPCMKMHPIGLYMRNAMQNYHRGLYIARQIGLSTHKDERAVAAGIVQADAICALLEDDLSRDSFLEYITIASELYEKPFNPKFAKEKGTLTKRLKWVRKNKDLDDEKAHEHLGSSSDVLDAYPFTIFMFQKYWDNPVQGLIETVNFGGDCDTTGAIFGALAGARHGMVFPQSWVDVLKNKDKLQKAAEGIYALRKNGI